jgi:membrane protease YdiL (CAAX protease family)
VTAGRRSRLRDTGFAIASCAVLAVYNNVSGQRPWRSRWYVPANACATGAALSAAAASGLTAADVGLGRGRWLPGRLASGLAAAVATGWLLIAVVPATRPLLGDKRITSLEGRAVAYQAAVRIPIGTVLWEEVAFRGVLQAALRRVLPRNAALTVTSVVFGIWHVRPTAGALRANGLAGDRGRAAAGVLAGVAVTTAAGAFLSWLRERSGRVAAPVLLHLAANSGGLVAAWAISGPADVEGPSRSGQQVG